MALELWTQVSLYFPLETGSARFMLTLIPRSEGRLNSQMVRSIAKLVKDRSQHHQCWVEALLWATFLRYHGPPRWSLSPYRTVPNGSRHFHRLRRNRKNRHVHCQLDSVALTLHEVLHRLRDDPLATRSHVAATPLIITLVSSCDEGCGVAVNGLHAHGVLHWRHRSLRSPVHGTACHRVRPTSRS